MQWIQCVKVVIKNNYFIFMLGNIKSLVQKYICMYLFQSFLGY